jgi:hypothetical protein
MGMKRVSNRYILENISRKRKRIEKACSEYSQAINDNIRNIIDDRKLGEYRRAEERETEAGFSLDNLVGKTILEHRKIKNMRKIRKYSSDYLDALIFSDKTFLVNEQWGDCECAHIDSYYFDGKNTRYSSELFGLI